MQSNRARERRVYCRSLVLLSLALLLGACSTALPKYMPHAVQTALGPVDAIVVATQDTPTVTISRLNPSGIGGITGILIGEVTDTVRRVNAHAEAKPIAASLQGFDFRTELLAAITPRIENLPNIRITVRPVDTVGTVAAAKALYDGSTASAVLFIVVRHSLVSGDLVLSATARLFPKAPDLLRFRPSPDSNPVAPGNAIYTNTFRVEKPLVTPANIQPKLIEAMNDLAAQLAVDLNTTR